MAHSSGVSPEKRKQKQPTKVANTGSIDDIASVMETETVEPNEMADTTATTSRTTPKMKGRNGKGHICPICSRAFTRGTHMRAHLNTHSAKRTKVVCSVPRCKKEYLDVKAWSVHFSSHHKNQQHKLKYFEGKLKPKVVENNSVGKSFTQLILENKKLKHQIQALRRTLKIRCATKLIKRYKIHIHKLSNTKESHMNTNGPDNGSQVDEISAAHALLSLRNV